MEDTWLTIEETAFLLDCSEKTVRNRLKQGLFHGKRQAGKWYISHSFLCRLIRENHENIDETTTCEGDPKHRKKSLKSLGKTSDLNRFNRGGVSPAGLRRPEPPPPPQPFHLRFAERPLWNVHEAVLRLQPEFEFLAQRLSAGNVSLRDDVIQEMALAVLEQTHRAPLQYLLTLAIWRGRDFLKYERQRGMISVDDARMKIASKVYESQQATSA